MRRTRAISWLAGGLVACALATAARADETQGIAPSLAMAARLRWMQFAMSSGRVTANSSYPGTNMTASSLVVGRYERIAIHLRANARGATSAVANLRYEQTTPDAQFEIDLREGKRLTIHRARPHDDYMVDFRQIPGADVVLEVVEQGARSECRGASFWHLYLAEPELVCVHLVPLLEVLRPSWQLAFKGARLEDSLLRRTRTGERPDRQQWARLVDELASPRFAERRAAERELLHIGQVVLPYLEHLDPKRLDAEQASRVRALVESLSTDYHDSVERVATWLSVDELIWLSLLACDNVAKRRAAAEQLADLSGEKIDFDPEGGPELRRAQVEALRARWIKPDSADDRPAPTGGTADR